MALFQKRPEIEQATQFYTLGQQSILLIVGLGNPGKEYDGTRHNIGFEALDAFTAANDFDPWVNKKDLKCEMANGRVGDSRVIAVKPTTFMNLSGEAVQAVAHFYKIAPDKIVVVHDELDINFGQIRLRIGGSDAGHNGLKSLIQHLGQDFGRIRVGIGPKQPEKMDSADFVLARFAPDQQDHLKELLRETTAILSEYAFSGGQLLQETRSFLV